MDTPIIEVKITYHNDCTCDFSVAFAGNQMVEGNATDLDEAFTQVKKEIKRVIDNIINYTPSEDD